MLTVYSICRCASVSLVFVLRRKQHRLGGSAIIRHQLLEENRNAFQFIFSSPLVNLSDRRLFSYRHASPHLESSLFKSLLFLHSFLLPFMPISLVVILLLPFRKHLSHVDVYELNNGFLFAS